MPVATSPRGHIDRRRLHAGLVKHAPGRRLVDRRAHPDIFPGHMQRVVNRIFAVHDRFDPHAGIHVNAAHQAIELAERPFGMDPALRQNLPFQDDLRIGDARNRNRLSVG